MSDRDGGGGTPRRLIYLTNARLPTEKAHGVQIMKMCEALTQTGLEVVLAHPRRRQPRMMRNEDPFDFYGVDRVFHIEPLPNLDVVRLERLLPRRMFQWAFAAHSLAWGRAAVRWASRYGGDLFYTRDPATAFWLTSQELPTVLEVHVIPGGQSRRLLRRVAASKSLMAVAPLTSHAAQRLVSLGFPSERVVVLPDGVDLRAFDELPDRDECRRSLGLPPEDGIVGYVGRFETMEMEKGITTLIEAIAILRRRGVPAPLLLCVGGPDSSVPTYLQRAEDLGVTDRVVFVGPVPHPQVGRWIRSCTVVTIPWPRNEFSAYYTSPMKLFEYMAAGTPIIASDLPALRDVLEHDSNAWLVPPGDPEALATVVTALLGDDEHRDALAQQARQDVEQYTWLRRAGRILSAAVPSLGP